MTTLAQLFDSELKTRLAAKQTDLEAQVRADLLDELATTGYYVTNVGSAGVGKTATVVATAKKLGIPLQKIKVARAYPASVKGVPTRRTRRARRTGQSHKGLTGKAWEFLRQSGVATSVQLGPILGVTMNRASSVLSMLARVHPTSIRRTWERFGAGVKGGYFRYNYVGKR